MGTDQTLGIGVIGFGGFAMFAVQQYVQVPGVRLAAMSGTHREAANIAARRFDVPLIEEPAEMVQRDDVDIVYIATPPFLHHQQALLALKAGKHVIVEKPLATTLEQADELIAAAGNNLGLVANLMQRYNPMFDRVEQLIRSRALGEVLHGYFENYASDSGLPPTHWFWDRDKSGGIFVEHGVHFFDMLEGWLGRGKTIAAQSTYRGGDPKIEDQVQATVRYGHEITFNHYHGFTQAGRVDRQELRLLFERGDITLHEWVPTRITVRGLADEDNMRKLNEIFPNSRIDVTDRIGPDERTHHARHKTFEAYQNFELNWGDHVVKHHRYGQMVQDLFKDQLKWIRDPSHERRITEANGRRSLEVALQARDLTDAGHR